jgi:hypothetical protein
MSKFNNIFKGWLPFAVVISAFCLLVYASVQQALRNGLNDPQIQMAEDTAYALDRGTTIEALVPAEQVEMSRSLTPFIVVFDNNGKPIASSGLLNGDLPQVPQGVFDSAKQNGSNRVTWQPASSVRIAAVVTPYKGGFVLAGRNMREVEQRESQTEMFAGVTWALTLIATFFVIAFGEIFLSEKK